MKSLYFNIDVDKKLETSYLELNNYRYNIIFKDLVNNDILSIEIAEEATFLNMSHGPKNVKNSFYDYKIEYKGYKKFLEDINNKIDNTKFKLNDKILENFFSLSNKNFNIKDNINSFVQEHIVIIDVQNHMLKGKDYDERKKGNEISKYVSNVSGKYKILLIADEMYKEDDENYINIKNDYIDEFSGFLDDSYYENKKLNLCIENNIYTNLAKDLIWNNKKFEIENKTYGYIRDIMDTNFDNIFYFTTLFLEISKEYNCYDIDINTLKEFCRTNIKAKVVYDIMINNNLNDEQIVDMFNLNHFDIEEIKERYKHIQDYEKINLIGGEACFCLLEEYISLSQLGYNNIEINYDLVFGSSAYGTIKNLKNYIKNFHNQKENFENLYEREIMNKINENKLNIFKVGGCIRDELLGLEPKDIDYVVVGSTPQEMLDLGYKKVGADFDVYLHPVTGDEYALARVERSTGKGYNDFKTIVENVTLEDDLLRRDLTINSIAKDKEGNYIDPYNGINDLNNKILKHTSEAFMEDPLRILRIARFNSRYVDFTIDESTIKLMKNMVNHGMIDHLTPERIWKEMGRSLLEKKPSNFFKVLEEVGALDKILPEIKTTNLLEDKLNKIDKISKLNISKEDKQLVMFNILCNDININDLRNITNRLGRFDSKIVNTIEIILKKDLFSSFNNLKKDIKNNKLENISIFFNNLKNKGFCSLENLYLITKNNKKHSLLPFELIDNLYKDYKDLDVEKFIKTFEENKGKKAVVEDIKKYVIGKQIKNFKKTLKNYENIEKIID